jgi:hypothetical protein
MKLWFGEHRDKDLTEVPVEYLNWLLCDTEPDIGRHDTAATIQLKRERWLDLMGEIEDEVERRHTEGKGARKLLPTDDDVDDEDDDEDNSFSALDFS